jgi:glycine/D-amino acid oxidase-like deaminating enzyme
VDTQYGAIKTEQLWICTNGFAKKLLPDLKIEPARAQVLVTSPIENLRLNSTYHYDSGYYYFRVVDRNRVLIGGARNLDFEGETSTDLETTPLIEQAIRRLLNEVILPDETFTIDYKWAGIMGVGEQKFPLVGSLNDRVHYAVRMGGMGVAMGSAIGALLAKEID